MCVAANPVARAGVPEPWSADPLSRQTRGHRFHSVKRKASPAATENTTVNKLTTDASAIERPNDTGMFAICPGLTMSSNHTVEKPTIGNVAPPRGPWNDKRYITSIGP